MMIIQQEIIQQFVLSSNQHQSCSLRKILYESRKPFADLLKEFGPEEVGVSLW